MTARRLLPTLPLLTVAALLGALVAGCGGGSTALSAYKQACKAYQAEDYGTLLGLLNKSTNDRIDGVDGLKALVPPISTLQPMVNAQLESMPADEMAALAEKPFFYRLEQALRLAKRGGGELAQAQTRFARFFSVPEGEIGALVDLISQAGSGTMIEIRYPGGDTDRVPATQDDGNWRIALPGAR